MEKLVSYVKDGHIKKVYYYYHTYNKELKSDEAKVFISYAELDDAINKDLESYKELLVSPTPTSKDIPSITT
jgi:major membrane immunogen (membrane-anchored lipoprotein)